MVVSLPDVNIYSFCYDDDIFWRLVYASLLVIAIEFGVYLV